MAKRQSEILDDIYICRNKINSILREYNCDLISQDEFSGVLLYDKDTDQTTGIRE